MPNYTIGPKIGLDGEKEFRQQLNNINESLRTLDSELKKTASEYEGNADSSEALQKQNEILNKEIEQQAKKIEEIQKALEYSKKEYGDNANQTLKWQRVLNNAQTDLNKLNNEVKKNETSLSQLGNAANQSEADLKSLGDAASNAGNEGSKLSNISDNLKTQTLMEASDILSEISDKAIEVGKAANESFQNIEGSTKKVTAYFGDTGQAAQDNAQVIKDIYEEGVGDSMDRVADSIIVVRQNLKDLNQEDLENITKQAIVLEDSFGVDMNETMRGVNSLMTQFGMSASQAMDLIVVGTQNGLDKTNELGDNVSEYAGKFEQAGYSAEEYFQLLYNGLDGGAYTLDKVNDAINEVTTRLANGTIAESLSIFSSGTQQVFQAWQNGKATQKDVINSIISDISSATSQQEALNMAATAFGSLGEDNNLQFISSLSSVGDTFSQVDGKANEFYENSKTSSQEIEGSLRQIKDSLAPIGESISELLVNILTPLADVIDELVEKFTALPQPIQDFILVFGGIITIATILIPIIISLAASFASLEVPLLPIIGIIAAVAAAIAAIIVVIKNWGTITDWLKETWEKFTTKISELWDTVKQKFDDLGNKIEEKLLGIGTSIENGFNSAIDFITSLPGKALQWGQDFIQSLIDGIKSKISGIVNSVKDIANTISSYLHFSVPDKGPLVDVPNWMPDMIDEMTKGIYNEEGKLETAAGSLAGKLATGLNMNAELTNTGFSKQTLIIDQPIILDGRIIANNTQKHISSQQSGFAMSRGKLNVRF